MGVDAVDPGGRQTQMREWQMRPAAGDAKTVHLESELHGSPHWDR